MLDFALGIMLLISALVSLHSKDLMKSGVFFLIFGFLSGLIWVRLEAFDVALVEIILGSAITGFLIFKLVKGSSRGVLRVFTFTKAWAGLVSLLFFLFMLFYLPTIERQDRVGRLVYENLHKSGVESAVNAVLLNFRGYDTLLEVGVITLAIFGLLALEIKREAYHWDNPILQSFSKLLLPFIVFFSLYITYLGTFSVGGAFQGGALLAGGLVFFALGKQSLPLKEFLILLFMVGGLGFFSLVGLFYALLGYGFLTYPLELSTPTLIFIELSIWISTAFLLYTAYKGRL
ncbi:MAG: hydrogenase subunit MbhD domain-containing protein [Aquificaceae bacterium]